MELPVNLTLLRGSVEWEQVIRPYLKERHAEIASRLARAAAKGDTNAMQIECGRLMEVEGLLGLEDLLREVETEENGRRADSRPTGWGRRWLRRFGRDDRAGD